MIWNGDCDIVSSEKEILMLRLLGSVLFEDLSRRRYFDSTSTLESHRWRVPSYESWRRSI